ncbi:unnamed protein product [Thelazia callipaeda]|uniref:Transmembrane protein n=1 Tax=Thelazia callipaeda TaxID=103827 RepID=A0A0N5CKS1_THECL|nr:unnamed protein product [Thelazia callipaeda]
MMNKGLVQSVLQQRVSSVKVGSIILVNIKRQQFGHTLNFDSDNALQFSVILTYPVCVVLIILMIISNILVPYQSVLKFLLVSRVQTVKSISGSSQHFLVYKYFMQIAMDSREISRNLQYCAHILKSKDGLS